MIGPLTTKRKKYAISRILYSICWHSWHTELSEEVGCLQKLLLKTAQGNSLMFCMRTCEVNCFALRAMLWWISQHFSIAKHTENGWNAGATRDSSIKIYSTKNQGELDQISTVWVTSVQYTRVVCPVCQACLHSDGGMLDILDRLTYVS